MGKKGRILSKFSQQELWTYRERVYTQPRKQNLSILWKFGKTEGECLDLRVKVHVKNIFCCILTTSYSLFVYGSVYFLCPLQPHGRIGKEDRMVRRDHLGYILKSFKSWFPRRREEIQESYCPWLLFFSAEMLYPISSKSWRKKICSFKYTPIKKGGYLIIVSILKSNLHLDSCSPVTANSQIMRKQRIRKEMANKESQHGPSSPEGTRDQQPTMESVQGSGKTTNEGFTWHWQPDTSRTPYLSIPVLHPNAACCTYEEYFAHIVFMQHLICIV